MSFNVTGDLTTRLESLSSELASAGDIDETLVASCLTDAYYEILVALAGRGLSKAEIDTWALGSSVELDIGTFFYGIRAGWEKNIPEGEAKTWLTRFDRRKELSDIAIVDADGTLISGGKSKGGLAMDLLTINKNLEV